MSKYTIEVTKLRWIRKPLVRTFTVELDNVCDRILLMEKGRIIKDIATGSSTLLELEEYFGVGQTAATDIVIDKEGSL